MSNIERFEDLEIWQLSREVSKEIYGLIKTTDLEQNFSLRNQMDRSSGSIMDNIAEGFERNGTREFIQFLSIAKASGGELRSQLYRVSDRGYCDDQTVQEVLNKVVRLNKKISTFMTYLIKSKHKGSIYKQQNQ